MSITSTIKSINRTAQFTHDEKDALRKVFSGVQLDTTNASTAHALNATFSDTEVEAALNALGSKINEIIAKLS